MLLKIILNVFVRFLIVFKIFIFFIKNIWIFFFIKSKTLLSMFFVFLLFNLTYLWTCIFPVCSHSTTRLPFYLFGEKYDFFRKNLKSPLIFVLFLGKNKIRKKTLSVVPYLEKTVCGKPKSDLGVKLLIGKVWQKTVTPL